MTEWRLLAEKEYRDWGSRYLQSTHTDILAGGEDDEDAVLTLANKDTITTSALVRRYREFVDFNSKMEKEDVTKYLKDMVGVNMVMQRDDKQYAEDQENLNMGEKWSEYTTELLKQWEDKAESDPAMADVVCTAKQLLQLRKKIGQKLQNAYGTERYDPKKSENRLPDVVDADTGLFSLYEGHGVKKGQLVQVMLKPMVPWRGEFGKSMSRRIMVVRETDHNGLDTGVRVKMVSAYGDGSSDASGHHWSSLDVRENFAFTPSTCALVAWLIYCDPGSIFTRYDNHMKTEIKTRAVTDEDCGLYGHIGENDRFVNCVCTEVALMKKTGLCALRWGFYLVNNKLPDLIEEEDQSEGRQTGARFRPKPNRLIAYLAVYAGTDNAILLYLRQREEDGMEIQTSGITASKMPPTSFDFKKKIFMSAPVSGLLLKYGCPKTEGTVFFNALQNFQYYMDAFALEEREKKKQRQEEDSEEDEEDDEDEDPVFDVDLAEHVENYLAEHECVTVTLDSKTDYVDCSKEDEEYSRVKLRALKETVQEYNCFTKNEHLKQEQTTFWSALRNKHGNRQGGELDFLVIWLTQVCDSLRAHHGDIRLPDPVLISSAADAPYGLVAADPTPLPESQQLKLQAGQAKGGKAVESESWQKARARYMNRMGGGVGLNIEHEVLLQAFVRAAFMRDERCADFDEVTYRDDNEATKFMTVGAEDSNQTYGARERVAEHADVLGKLAADFEEVWRPE